MEWLKEVSFSELVSTISGLILVGYAAFQGIKKACGDMDWYRERQAKKEKTEKEKRYSEWKEFQKKIKEENKESDKQELKNLYDEFTQSFVDKYANKVIEEIHNTDKIQNEKIDKLVTSSNDLLRETIINIYYRYLPYRKIPAYRMQYFLKLYADYHGQGGNSFVDDIYHAVTSWTVVQTEEEVKGEVKS